MGVAPGVGVDVDAVAVLGEAVDEGADAGGARKDGAPLLEGEVVVMTTLRSSCLRLRML